VVDDKDPEQRNRVRVRSAHVYGAAVEEERIGDLELPWALPAQAVFGGTGESWTPPIGSAVWVMFLGGSHEDPIYWGGYSITADAIPEHKTSYGPSPATRIIKTLNGHAFEMRYKVGEEYINLSTALLVALKLIDSEALGGPKVLLQTPAMYRLVLDEKLGIITLATPGGFSLVINQSGAVISITTAAGNSVTLSDAAGIAVTTPGPLLSLSAVAGVLSLSALTLTLVATAALSLSATAVLAITGGTGLALLTAAGLVTLGVAGSFQALATAQFVNTTYATHTHAVTTAPGVTGVPVPLPVPGDLTTNTMAN
jgi:hypothetical protein